METEKQNISNGAGKSNYLIIASIVLAALIVVGAIVYLPRVPGNSSGNNPQGTPIANTSQSLSDSGKLIASGLAVLGNPAAPVTIIEYAGYLCGHCVNFHLTTFPKIFEKYIKTGKVKFVSRAFPPEFSQAVLCASDQGKLWEYDDYLYKNAGNIRDDEDLMKATEELGLNKDFFRQCLSGKKYEAETQKWLREAENANVSGTPTFFINGEEIVGNQPLEVFESTIDKFINK